MIRLLVILAWSSLLGIACGGAYWAVTVKARFGLEAGAGRELMRAADVAWTASNLVDVTHRGAWFALAITAVTAGLTLAFGSPLRKDRRHLRGSTLASQRILGQMTDARTLRNRLQRALVSRRFSAGARGFRYLAAKFFGRVPQTTIADVRIPVEVEALHFLIAGTTGAGKSQAIKELVEGAKARDDRLVIVDPNGDYYSIFGADEDVVMNPFDARSPGWSIFNEIRSAYDCERFSRTVIPDGHGELKSWHGYAQFLFKEIMLKLHSQGCRDSNILVKFVCDLSEADLKAYLADTAAAGMFAEGSERSLGSTRFICTKFVTPHKYPKNGDFSLRRFLEGGKGNLFITWREDMAEALKPLISTWYDVLITSTLSLKVTSDMSPIWFFCDELGSMEQLSSLEAGLTKGRKFGARFCSGVQSTAQLADIYGKEKAVTLRSCYRNVMFLNIPHTDPETAEELSKGIGDVEMLRAEKSRSVGFQSSNRSTNFRRVNERLIMPSQIHELPNLEGFLCLAGDYPVARVKLRPRLFQPVRSGFIAIDAPEMGLVAKKPAPAAGVAEFSHAGELPATV